MESNLCDGNHSDSNVLLPPRKRLLAGFKKQNSDPFFDHSSISNKKGVFDTRINNLMENHLRNPNLSIEMIVEESSKAAEEAAKVAVAARSVAEEKAVIAAKAMTGAKNALELVATISDEFYSKDRYLKKNKIKKHLPVNTLYNKNVNVKNCETDEELARKLHHAINSSPRNTRHSTNSNLKNKNKRLKSLSYDEGTSNRNSENEVDETDSEDLIGVSENTSKLIGNNSINIVNGEGESSHSKEIISEILNDFSSVGRKRGRMKQKKLPISICSIRDLANTNVEMKSNCVVSNEEGKFENNVATYYKETQPDNVTPPNPTSMWKCKAFKAPVCVQQNKVMEP